MFETLRKWAEFVKLSHTVFALPFALAAMLVAARFGGAIVNADAMQFYKGMDIGTAKLTLDERRGIQHHLFDWLEVTEESTAANYQVFARAKIQELIDQVILPIVVGDGQCHGQFDR